MKLNIGCGFNILDGYVNVDKMPTTPKTVVMDLMALDFENGVASEIYMRHVIEHFFEDQINTLLAACARILQPGGKLVIETPDFERIMYAWQNNILDKTVLNAIIFGFAASVSTRERELHMMHKYAFDEALLTQFLSNHGLSVVEVEKGAKPSDFDPKYGDYLTHMRVVAVKKSGKG